MERAWNHHQPLKGQKLRTIFLVKSNVGRSTRKTQLRVTIQMKAIEQYFHVYYALQSSSLRTKS